MNIQPNNKQMRQKLKQESLLIYKQNQINEQNFIFQNIHPLNQQPSNSKPHNSVKSIINSRQTAIEQAIMRAVHHHQQKRSSDYTCTMTTNVHACRQSPVAIQKKSSTVMKKFEYCIASNATPYIKHQPQSHHYRFFNEQHPKSPLTPSNIIMKSKKPTQKPVVMKDQTKHSSDFATQKANVKHFIQEYEKIIDNLTLSLKYYEWELFNEIAKHNKYFEDMKRVIDEEKKKSHECLNKSILKMREEISMKIGAIENKIHTIKKSQLNSFEKEKEELNSQSKYEMPSFRVLVPELDTFRQQVKRHFFHYSTLQEYEKELLQPITSTKQSPTTTQQPHLHETFLLQEQQQIRTQKKQKPQTSEYTTCQQIQQMTPIHPQAQQLTLPLKPVIGLEDTDLYCDEDIENILKDNKIVRRKRYECREDAIPEESESHQDSGILSNAEFAN